MKFLYKIVLLASVVTSVTAIPSIAATCSPTGICNACTNCSSCGNCSKRGGSCSVCRGSGGGRGNGSSSSSTSSSTRSTFRSTPNYTPPSANEIAAYTRQQEAESRRQQAIRRQNQRQIDAWYAKQPYTAKCIGVADGDTITVLKDRKQIRIRLYGIDAPEKNQAFGQQAKNSLSKAAFNKYVKVFPQGTDRYGRTLAWLFVGDKCLNREMVANGMAWHYAQYAPREQRLASLQSQARTRKIGLWSAAATPPWSWRRNR
jgi:micrococcal nuclease